MTKEYETIRAIRNKMFPPVLEFGCEVIAELTGFVPTTDNVKVIDKVTSLGDNINMQSSITAYREYCGQIILDLPYDRYYKEILGTPVSLNDILRMLSKTADETVELYTNDGETNIHCKYNGEFYNIEIDLSSSIKDQTPEVLSAIIKLIED